MKPVLIIFAFLVLLPLSAQANTWKKTKNFMDDEIYKGRETTLYCGCPYQSHEDRDGSGDILYGDGLCEYDPEQIGKHVKRAARVEWEHIVPASITPAREMKCWTEGLEECKKPGRHCCEKHSEAAQAIIFDPYNLAPSIGQINALRSNDRYEDLPDEASDFNMCKIEDIKGAFEPRDCVKGDVARVWLYMEQKHDLELTKEEQIMYLNWSEGDPVSPREAEIAALIEEKTGLVNHFVSGVSPDISGSCVR